MILKCGKYERSLKTFNGKSFALNVPSEKPNEYPIQLNKKLAPGNHLYLLLCNAGCDGALKYRFSKCSLRSYGFR